jgi:hypothetical protein
MFCLYQDHHQKGIGCLDDQFFAVFGILFSLQLNRFLKFECKCHNDLLFILVIGPPDFTPMLEATSQCWSEGKKGGDTFQKFGESSSG